MSAELRVIRASEDAISETMEERQSWLVAHEKTEVLLPLAAGQRIFRLGVHTNPEVPVCAVLFRSQFC